MTQEEIARANGTSSVLNILRADYGTWPPHGLNLVIAPRQAVRFAPMSEHMNAEVRARRLTQAMAERRGRSAWLNSLFKIRKQFALSLEALLFHVKSPGYGGAIHGDRQHAGGRTIYHGSLLSANTLRKYGVLGHEAVHIAQQDHSKGRRISNTDTSANRIVGEFWQAARRFPLRTFMRTLDKSWRDTYENPPYLLRGTEMQARLHTLLAHGHRHWGRLPGNKEELHAALIALGVTAPRAVHEALQQSPTGQQALQAFGPVPGRPRSEAGQINWAQRHIKRAHKFAFWDRILPRLCADLYEMYGDGPGRARFGLGENKKLATSWLALLREPNGGYDAADYRRWAQALSPAQRQQAFATLRNPAQRGPNDAALLQALGMPVGRTVQRDAQGQTQGQTQNQQQAPERSFGRLARAARHPQRPAAAGRMAAPFWSYGGQRTFTLEP